jgi:dTDP-4-dehydrorhamnose 3,5-epimerase
MRTPLTVEDLDPKLTQGFKTQQYAKSPRIDGVRVIELSRFAEDCGAFAEVFRLIDGRSSVLDGFQILQVNYSDLEPGAIKAFHFHLNQEDVWFVPPVCKLLAGLVDLRRHSPSCGLPMRMILGDGRAQLLYIPRGVAHGVANISVRRQILMYFVNSNFSVEAPDEQRLDPHLLGGGFWEIQPG